MDRKNLLQISIFDYIKNDGIKEISQENLEKISDYKWATKDTVVYTIEDDYLGLEFTYFLDGTLIFQSLSFFKYELSIRKFLDCMQKFNLAFKYETFILDEDELIFIFENGSRVHFHYDKNNYFLKKIYSDSYFSSSNKNLIENTMENITNKLDTLIGKFDI